MSALEPPEPSGTSASSAAGVPEEVQSRAGEVTTWGSANLGFEARALRSVTSPGSGWRRVINRAALVLIAPVVVALIVVAIVR